MGELGLKPDEFRRMTPYEYNTYANGCAFREQVHQYPFRKLYQLIYNVNAKHPIRGAQIIEHWPLPDLDKHMNPLTDMDEARQRMEEARAANKERKRRQQELKQRQENANGRS